MMDIVACNRFEVSATSLFERSPAECVNECDQVQQRPTAPTMSRQKEVTIRKKGRRTEKEVSKLSVWKVGKPVISINVDMDDDTANLNVQALSYAALKITT
jgi:hypothetical protein